MTPPLHALAFRVKTASFGDETPPSAVPPPDRLPEQDDIPLSAAYKTSCSTAGYVVSSKRVEGRLRGCWSATSHDVEDGTRTRGATTQGVEMSLAEGQIVFTEKGA